MKINNKYFLNITIFIIIILFSSCSKKIDNVSENNNYNFNFKNMKNTKNTKEQTEWLTDLLYWINNDLNNEELNNIKNKLLKYKKEWNSDFKLLWWLGRIYLLLWDYEEWILVMKEANKLTDYKDGSFLFRLWTLYLENWSKDEANKYFEEAKKYMEKWTDEYNALLKFINYKIKL